jgi:hypothetical protein
MNILCEGHKTSNIFCNNNFFLALLVPNESQA